MAYFPRPDGLVDVDIGGGRMLPMNQAYAEAAGHGPAPAPMPDPVLPPNPYSALPPDAVAGPGGGPTSAMQTVSKWWHKNDDWKPHTSPIPNGPVNEQGIPIAGIEAANSAFSGSTGAPQSTPAATESKAAPAGPPAGLRQIVPTGRPQQAPEQQSSDNPRYVQTAPARDVRASYIVKPGVEADPQFADYEKDQNPVYDYQDRLVSANDAFDAREKARVDDMERLNQQQAQQQAQQAQIAQNRAVLQTKLDAVDQRQKEAEQATPQTRQEILASRGTLAGVMSGISIALGGWVQGLKGGSNPGLDIVNQSIQDDISTQRSKYEAMKDRTAAANTAYGQAMKLYGDPNAAENDLYMRGLTLAANISANHWKQGENIDEMTKQKAFAQQLMEQAMEKRQAAYTLIHGQVAQENYKYQPAQVAQIGGPPEEPVHVEKMITLPNGTRAWATTTDAAKQVQGVVSAGSEFDSQLSRLKALTSRVGDRVPTANERAEAETIKQEASNAWRASHGVTRITPAEQDIFEKSLGNQTDVFRNPNSAAHLTELRQQTANHVNAALGQTYTDPTYRKRLIEGESSSFQSGSASPLSYPPQGPITMPKKAAKGRGAGRAAPEVVEEEPEE